MNTEQIRETWVQLVRQATHDYGYGSKVMPQLDGGTTRYGRVKKCVWPLVATLCRSANVDPSRLFAHILREARTSVGSSPPRLSSYLTESFVRSVPEDGEVTRRQVEEINVEVRRTWALVAELIVAGWTGSAAVQHLGCAGNQGSPLAAYIMAKVFDCPPALLDALWPAAYQQFCRCSGVASSPELGPMMDDLVVAYREAGN